MNKKRLLKLADLLEADAKNAKGVKFDLRNWGDTTEGKKVVSCGTTACAMGLAVASKAFSRQGLQGYSRVNPLCPLYEGKVGFEAAARLFDINMDASFFLFSDDNYPKNRVRGATGERYVAKRIRDFVAGKVAP